MALAVQGAEAGNELVLTVTLTVAGRVPGAVALRLELPPGAKLLEGQAEEHLSRPSKGTLQRTFRLAGVRGPVKVTADSLGKSAGAYATASFPATTRRAQPANGPTLRPMQPVRVQGVTIDRSVPLTPAGSK